MSFSALLDEFFYRPDEETGQLFDMDTLVDESAPAAPEEAPSEYLVFALESERYAIPVDAVREIVKVPRLTEVPRSADNLLGVMNLRGEVLPVYEVKRRLHLSESAPVLAGPDAQSAALPKSARIVVVRDEEGDAGVLVDSVQEVLRLKPSTIEVPPAGLGSERDCIVGIGRRRDQLFILIDIHQALA
ncbi:MAG: chemotaxis protein CheW [Myxococcaceae bacterium]